MPWCSEFQANLLESNATGYQCTGSESSCSSACAKASFCPQLAPCNILAAPKIHLARPQQAELGHRPYHCIVAIAGKDDHVNGGCVIGHADASVSGSVFSKCKTKTQMRAEEQRGRPARGTARSGWRGRTVCSRQRFLTGRGR